MPDEEKKTVDIDTSGPDASIEIEEAKDESVVNTEAPFPGVRCGFNRRWNRKRRFSDCWLCR